MAPEELLTCSSADLARIAATLPHADLQDLFGRIWEKVRPLYAGQPKSTESVRALSLAQAALTLASHAGDGKLLIESWHMMGRSLSANEEFAEAIPFYRRVISALQDGGELQRAARLHLALVAVLLNADRYSEAFKAARDAETLFRNNHDEVGLARLYHNIANIYHRTDDHARAYEHYSKAYEIFQKLGDEHDLAHSCFNIANALAEIDRFDKSDEMYLRSIEMSRKLGMTDVWTQANYNRAYLQYLRGRYSVALESFSRLRNNFEAAGSLRHAALCDLDEAEIYLQLNLSTDAASLACRAAEQFEKLGLRYEQAKATAFYGVALIQLRRFSEAVDVFGRAQRVFEPENNNYWIGLLDLYRAEVHLLLQRYWDAQVLAGQAKAVFEELGIPSRKIMSLVLLGRVSLALNDVITADRYVTEIAADIHDVKMPLVLFPYHVLCAEIAERKRKAEEAQLHYEAAAQELERHQAGMHHDDLRVTFLKGRHLAYDGLIRLALELPDPVQALSSAYAWCERARSRALIELLSHCSPPVRSDREQPLSSKITRLREELNTHYARLQPESRRVSSSTEYERIAAKEQELARTLREVSSSDPEYASLQQVSIATLESLQGLLPETTTVIEYFNSGEEMFAFVISAKQAGIVRNVCSLSHAADLQEQLEFQFEAFMLGSDFIDTHSQQILQSTKRRLHQLYRDLLSPFIGRVETPHLVIVPHGSLHFLPFHAFYDGGKYLIDHFEISYAPSASVLKYCLEKKSVAGTSPLLVGVADENAPMVADEIACLSRLFPAAEVLLNEKATRDAFIEKSQKSLFLHIATHAIFRDDNPMFSGFRLGDGWFTALDLFSIACQTNLVTLSACQSGMTKVMGAGDLLGLMRGFLYAGARSLLLSLWNVSDESTMALMTRFYEEWDRNVPKSVALRRAMLAIREERPNPFHWAPFLLAGSW